MIGDYFIINYFHIQILITQLLFCYKSPKKNYFYFKFVPLTIVYCVLPFVVSEGYFNKYISIGSWFTFGFLIMMLFCFGLMFISFKIPVMELIFYSCVSHTLQHFTNCFARLVQFMFKLDNLGLQICIFIVSVITYFLTYFVFVKKIQTTGKVNYQSPVLVIFAFASTIFIYVISLWASITETSTHGALFFELFCCVLLLVIFFDLFENRLLKQNEQIILHMLSQQHKQHQLSRSNIETINLKCHDLKNQLIALKNISDSEQKNQLINDIQNDIMIYDSFAKTGNHELDILLAEKALTSEADKVQLRYMVDGSLFDFISTGDLYSLLGNALDNAIEAVKKIEDTNQRIVSFNAYTKLNYLFMHIENPCFDNIVFKEGLPQTTKSNKEYHGFGLKSISFITQKYNGQVNIKHEDNIFNLDIILPLTTNK